MRVLIAAGGTGGHIYPGITVAQVLRDQGAEVVFVGTKDGLEADVIPRAGFCLRAVRAHHIPRRVSWEVPMALVVAVRGTYQAMKVIRQFRPHVVMGTGGYVSGPVLLAATVLRYPTLIHEQNAFPGITNRMLARVVDEIAVGYAEAKTFFPAHKTVVTCNPVRPEISTCTREAGQRTFGLDPKRRTLLVTAGSQGARSVNRALLQAAPMLHARRDLQVLHAAGRALYPEVVEQLRSRGVEPDAGGEKISYGNMCIMPYIYAMPEALAAADLVVGRGGALSSAEFTIRGLPAILVPYPHAAENHQLHNAQVLEAHGAAKVLLDHEISGQTLGSLVTQLLDTPGHLQSMARASKRLGKPNATGELVALVKALAAPT
jgi:UDP-N-acetylglucosamine--N-acetylmuramyl-(pentapeptide) pyrophosphoryl-undecaprenol N-acetylglucosamine transferase